MLNEKLCRDVTTRLLKAVTVCYHVVYSLQTDLISFNIFFVQTIFVTYFAKVITQHFDHDYVFTMLSGRSGDAGTGV